MNIALAPWGALNAVEMKCLDDNLDDFLGLFIDEYYQEDGPLRNWRN